MFRKILDKFRKSKLKDRQLQAELNQRIVEIKRTNYARLMTERLIPYVRENALAQEGILLTDSQLLEVAHGLFCRAKQDGKIDELNNVIR